MVPNEPHGFPDEDAAGRATTLLVHKYLPEQKYIQLAYFRAKIV
jgi:hypothetical protein